MTTRRIHFDAATLAWMLVAIATQANLRADEPAVISITLADPELSESSGMVFSSTDPSCIWSHNDSGDHARLFAFDAKTGEATGQWDLQGVTAVDWEDLAMLPPVNAGGPARLVIADSGDNQKRRDHIELLVIDEMDPRKSGVVTRENVRVLRIKYPDGAQDCEAIWFDEPSQGLILLCKRFTPWVGLYRVALKDGGNEESSTDLVAELIQRLPLALATAADRDPVTGDVWVSTYWQAIKFAKADHVALKTQMSQTPVAFDLPKLKQIEAIAVDSESNVWVTSEGSPAPLVRLNVR
ncbi:hypothetical protein RBSH_03672 [Rhodopirellula baltica SH28]|uniref:Integral membrane protein n=1 Tax=Rhodopirellula baltica SH28 TaxID=993517 RepID=K5DEU7_RHOBT|nr:hypothetical protein [Rhodopirellula baltica]EKK00998.1 hypothetical protein RBSH_03672 [Rhodopirellula baltica SH28]